MILRVQMRTRRSFFAQQAEKWANFRKIMIIQVAETFLKFLHVLSLICKLLQMFVYISTKHKELCKSQGENNTGTTT